MSEKVTAGVDLDALPKSWQRYRYTSDVWPNGWTAIDNVELDSIIAELRAARAVVAAAREVADAGRDHYQFHVQPSVYAVDFALAAYDRLTGERQ